MYELEQRDGAPSRRVGGVQLFRAVHDPETPPSGSRFVACSPLVRTSGVFDVKWLEEGPNGQRTLVVAEAEDAAVSLHSLAPSDAPSDAPTPPDPSPASRLALARPGDADTFCLCVDAQPSWAGTDLAASTSDGHLHVISRTPAGLSSVAPRRWRAHGTRGPGGMSFGAETWCAAFDHGGTCPWLLYSGADDAAFKGWDLRGPPDAPPALRFALKEAHGAGVCCIRTHPRVPWLVCTSGYDGALRVWDARRSQGSVASAVGETPLGRGRGDAPNGGGVWRIAWPAWDPALILGACMQGGCAAWRLPLSHEGGVPLERAPADEGGAKDDPSVLDRIAAYGGHASEAVAYGIGALGPAEARAGGDGKVRAVSCSFYDNEIHGWVVPALSG